MSCLRLHLVLWPLSSMRHARNLRLKPCLCHLCLPRQLASLLAQAGQWSLWRRVRSGTAEYESVDEITVIVAVGFASVAAVGIAAVMRRALPPAKAHSLSVLLPLRFLLLLFRIALLTLDPFPFPLFALYPHALGGLESRALLANPRAAGRAMLAARPRAPLLGFDRELQLRRAVACPWSCRVDWFRWLFDRTRPSCVCRRGRVVPLGIIDARRSSSAATAAPERGRCRRRKRITPKGIRHSSSHRVFRLVLFGIFVHSRWLRGTVGVVWWAPCGVGGSAWGQATSGRIVTLYYFESFGGPRLL